ncbi:MAG: DUF2095 family protein [Betaproteobacteria bacterium]|jgi:hypothetical protein
MALDKKDLKKMFPHLYEELESGEVKVPISGVRKNASEPEGEVSEECSCDEYIEEEKNVPLHTETPDKLRHFNPQAVDFIRRCDTEAQVEEIINYLEKKGEITSEFASQLRCQLKKDGVRSFGPKKEENYYFREGGLC